jgi:DNA-binding LacI/PurR family transcriptional regulator
MSGKAAIKGRGLSAVLGQIREQIASSFYRQGGFLPSTRDLAEQFGVSAETVRRGLKQLEREGVLEARPRSGFRVALPGESSQNRPVAFITHYRSDLADAQPATWALSIAFQGATAVRDWSMLGAHSGGRSHEAVVEQIRGGNAWGVILDTIEGDLRREILRVGVPVVMINSWVEDIKVDVVLQDNYRGGFLAADHLVAWGAKRIAWVGQTSEFCHSRERFAGAGAALRKHGLCFEDDLVVNPGPKEPVNVVRRLLASKDRPDGVLAFGPYGMTAVHEAGVELGLKLGSDLEMVGWIVEECYDLHYRPIFEGGYLPPAIIWSAREMAERAVSLLAERGEGAGRRAVRACISTELRTSGGER